MKYLIWIAIAYVAVSWFLRSKKTSGRKDGRAAKSNDAEQILQCVHCGVHIPASEAIITQTGAIFCCEEHRLQVKKS